MAEFTYTCSYANCGHSFMISGVERSEIEDQDLKSFTCVIRNLLARSYQTFPSIYLTGKLGALPPDLNTEYYLYDASRPLPQWFQTIKGAGAGKNPARDFFYDDSIWEKYLPELPWVRHALIPEADMETVLQDYSGKWKHQSVDFYLPAAKLVIEIDGAQHQEDPHQAAQDNARDLACRSCGITVTRISVDSLLRQDEEFDVGMQDISEQIRELEITKLIQEQEQDEALNQRIRYDIVLRYQMALLLLLENGTLTWGQGEWQFWLAERQEELFQLAAEDLFLWYKNLYTLKGLPFTAPKISITKGRNAIHIHNDIFSRKDERKTIGINITTDYWDDIDFYQFSSAKEIKYDIPWPSTEDSDRGRALLFFLQNIFHKEKFNPGQWQILVNILNMNKTIGILPTGGGKSLCYQLAAVLQPMPSIVVSPLNSLQIDQRDNFHKAGFIRTDYIGSTQSTKEKSEILERFRLGMLQLIWISPERFQSREFRNTLKRVQRKQKIAYAVIDEVHCLSEWGHDFRPSYLTLIHSIEKLCSPAVLVGLTATASQNVLDDLKVEFNIGSYGIRAMPTLERENLSFEVVKVNNDNKKDQLYRILSDKNYGKPDVEPEIGIIFTCTQDVSDEGDYAKRNHLAEDIRKRFPDNSDVIGTFHSERKLKVKVQKQFLNNKLRLLSSTKAFGMGIDKQDISFTIHYNLPWSVESFYQEAGRAGRNKDLNADCYILFDAEMGKQDTLDIVFDRHTTPEAIQGLMKKRLLKGDLNTLFFLWLLNNKGVEHEKAAITNVLNQLDKPPFADDDGKYYKISPIPYGKADTELALYRLHTLGIVEDWLINWNDNPISFDVYFKATWDRSAVEENLKDYFKRRHARRGYYLRYPLLCRAVDHMDLRPYTLYTPRSDRHHQEALSWLPRFRLSSQGNRQLSESQRNDRSPDRDRRRSR